MAGSFCYISSNCLIQRMIYSIVIEERNIQFDALDTHDDYVYQTQNYIQQKQDETLQEMETRFNVQEKERQLERNR